MIIHVNGRAQTADEDATLDELVPQTSGVAVAINGAVVPVAAWRTTGLRDGDTIEIVTAHQGG